MNGTAVSQGTTYAAAYQQQGIPQYQTVNGSLPKQPQQPQQQFGQYTPADFAHLQQQYFQSQQNAPLNAPQIAQPYSQHQNMAVPFRTGTPLQQNTLMHLNNHASPSYSPVPRPNTAMSGMTVNGALSHASPQSAHQQSPTHPPAFQYPTSAANNMQYQQLNAHQQMASYMDTNARMDAYRRNQQVGQLAQQQQQMQNQQNLGQAIYRPPSAAANAATPLQFSNGFMKQPANPFVQQQPQSQMHPAQASNVSNASSATGIMARPQSVNSMHQQQPQNETPKKPNPPGPANFYNPELFIAKLREHLNSIGQPMEAVPQIEGRPVDLVRLFQMVIQRGGNALVTHYRQWPWITTSIGYTGVSSPTNTNPPTQPIERVRAVHEVYQRYLASFETQFMPNIGRQAAQILAQTNAVPAQTSQLQQQKVASSQQQESVAATQPVEMKQKGKAQTPSRQRSVKQEVPEAKTNIGENRPVASTSALAKPTVAPSESASPKLPAKRRKQLIEYTPATLPAINLAGGYNTKYVEDISNRHKPKRRRVAQNLNVMDIHLIVMSLKSGIPTEVAYGLNALTLVSELTRTASREQNGLILPLSSLDDLLEALLDLIEETAFPVSSPPDSRKRSPNPALPSTYAAHFAHIVDNNFAHRQFHQAKNSTHSFLQPAKIILSSVNLLRVFSQTPENLDSFAQSARLVDLLLRLCQFTTSIGDAKLPACLKMSTADVLVIRKDAIVILSELGLELKLDSLPSRCTHAIWELTRFFLLDMHEHENPMLSSNLPAESEVCSGALNTYTDLALTAFAAIGVQDGNREMFSRAIRAQKELIELFEALVRSLPVAEEDLFSCLQKGESALNRLERTAMCLFNLAFIASYDTKRKLRNQTGFEGIVRRNISWLSMLAQNKVASECWPAFQRLLEVIQLITADSVETDAIDPTAPFFAGGFADEADNASDTAISLDMTRQVSDNTLRKQAARAPPLYSQQGPFLDIVGTKAIHGIPPEIVASLMKVVG